MPSGLGHPAQPDRDWNVGLVVDWLNKDLNKDDTGGRDCSEAGVGLDEVLHAVGHVESDWWHQCWRRRRPCALTGM